jgi:spore coat polysaccharide biosynthesis protein SpsF
VTRVVAIVQARMSSTRLPGKVLRPLGDRSTLAHVISRLRASRRVDEVAVATSTGPEDDPIVTAGEDAGVAVIRGSRDDVLERYRAAAQALRADVVVRVTSDCPAFDPYVLDAMLASWGDADDYVSNVHPRTYPRGLDAEIVRRSAIERAAEEAVEAADREHVTPYLYLRRPDLFRRRGVIRAGEDLSTLRWTLDTAEDAAFFDALIASYGLKRFATDYRHESLVAFLRERPGIGALNAGVEQKALEPPARAAEER